MRDGFNLALKHLGGRLGGVAADVQTADDQFSPDTGKQIIDRFVTGICGCHGDWNMPDYVSEAVAKIRAAVGAEEVILGLSGGVDSAVAAVLIHEAIGERLTCVFVDHGLMRQGEAQDVVSLFRDHYNIPLVHVDASELFIGALEEIGRAHV